MENEEKYYINQTTSHKAFEAQEEEKELMIKMVEILFDLWTVNNSSKCPNGSFNN